MRTTISISDELLKQARKASVERGCSLGEVIEEALKVTLLARKKPGHSEVPRAFKTFAGNGFQAGVDPHSNASLEDLMSEP